jgi:hypothetical protein
MRKTYATVILAAVLTLGAPAKADASAKWLSPREGWKPVPVDIRRQVAEDGISLGRHARIKYGDTTYIDIDGKPGGTVISS